jgi:hypothetical protein
VQFYVGSEAITRVNRPVGGPVRVPDGRLHAISPDSVVAECGLPLGNLHRWPTSSWVSGYGTEWCKSCLNLTHHPGE